MKIDRLQSFALALPQTTVVSQWGGLVFKVAGKVFLMFSLDGGVLEGVAFKCPPAEFDALTALDGLEQAPYFAKRHWVILTDPAALPEAELIRQIRRSYELVAAGLPKKTRLSLGLAPDAHPPRRLT